MTHVNLVAIPAELRAVPQWVVWQAPNKIPFSPHTLLTASSTDRATWGTFDEACACHEQYPDRFAGIGFCFSPDDPYCGIDLDDCLAEGGIPHKRSWRMVERLASYTEISPSGRGLKIIVKASKPGGKCKAPIEWDGNPGQVEIYDRARYFTITGNVMPDTPEGIEPRQDQVDALYRFLFPSVVPGITSASVCGIADRVHRYLEKCPDSISGQGGHDKCLRAACECMRFGLSDADTGAIMRWWSAEKSGAEPWSDREIAHKIASARAKVAAEGQLGIRVRGQNPQAPLAAVPETFRVAEGVAERTKQIGSGEYAAAPWIWPKLGRLTQALLPGAVTILAAEPGVGKSFFVLCSALGWLELGVSFSVFMLEEDRTYHLMRALAALERNAGMVDLEWVKNHNAETIAASGRHKPTIEALGKCIHDAPEARVSLGQLADWYESIAPTSRVVVIDPVTAASAGERRWIEDGIFMERIKTIARQSGTSVVLVTHPKLGKKGAITMDDLAGGADYPRFSQTVLSLALHNPAEPVMCSSDFGRRSVEANRILRICKARNGRGGGMKIAFEFSPDSLAFGELGVIVDD